MRLPAAMTLGWGYLPRLRVVVLGLAWLGALCWAGVRASGGETKPNPVGQITASPTGFLPTNAHSLPLSTLLKVGHVLERGAAPLPLPDVIPAFGARGRGLQPKKYAVLALAVQPLWLLLIYASFIAWVASLLAAAGAGNARPAHEALRLWLRVLLVGFIWLLIVEAVRLAGLFASFRFGQLGEVAPNRWLQVAFAWLLAFLRVLAILAMCTSAMRGGLLRGAARHLVGVLRTRALPLLATLFVSGLLLFSYDWVVRGSEISFWPRERMLSTALGLTLIAARATLGIWLLASLLTIFQSPPLAPGAPPPQAPAQRSASHHEGRGRSGQP